MAIYDEEQARKDCQQLFDNLVKFKSSLENYNPESITREQLESLHKQYLSFPVTYQVNWSLLNKSPEEVQVIADEIRNDLMKLNSNLGSNRMLPRLFYHGQE